MNKKISIIFIICLANIFYTIDLYAQTWCPAGATWYYQDYFMGNEGYSKLTYEKDTVINGINCKKIIGFSHDQYEEKKYSPYYTYQKKNGLVYLYNDLYGINKFELLFDITFEVGDRWRMPRVPPSINDSLYFFEVLKTGSKRINGVDLKWLYVKMGPSLNTYSFQYDTITERLGFRFSHLDYSGGLVDGPGGDLRCYSDDIFGFYSTNINIACDMTTGIAESIENSDNIKIYPNPANDKLSITLPINKKSEVIFNLYNLSGRTVLSKVLYELADNEISMAQLSNGIYMYELKIDETITKIAKIAIIH